MSIPKTSSGKIQRRACKKEYLEEKLSIVGEWREEEFTNDNDKKRNSTRYKMWLQNWIEKKMKIPSSKIDFYKPVTYYPFDSITAIELEADLDTEFGIKILPQYFFQVSLLIDILTMIEKQGVK